VRAVILVITAFASGSVVTAWLTAPAAAQPRPTATTEYRPAVTAELLRADLADWCPGKEVVITVTANGPRNAAFGRHFHPGHSFSWIIEGSQTVYPDGATPYDVTTGDVIHEQPFQISATGNTAPTKVLVLRILEKGQPPTTNVD
jgi:hypothetical protein